MAILMGGTPIGAPVVGWVAAQFGPRVAILIGAAARSSRSRSGRRGCSPRVACTATREPVPPHDRRDAPAVGRRARREFSDEVASTTPIPLPQDDRDRAAVPVARELTERSPAALCSAASSRTPTRSRWSLTNRPSGSSRSNTARASASRGCTRSIARAIEPVHLAPVRTRVERRERLLDGGSIAQTPRGGCTR